jgi:CRP/FNR family transcriptional regulator, anaerobic regulatory protein
MIKIEQVSTHFPFIEKLSPECQTELIEHSRISFKNKEDILLTRGDQVSGAYLVIHGELEVFTISDEGRETVLYTIGNGESCVFALNALFNDIVYPAWVRVATNEAKIVFVDGPFFRRSFNAEKSVRDWVWEVQSMRVIDLMCSIDEILNLSIVERLKHYLIRSMNKKSEVKKTHESIAKHLGVSREVITRKLKILADNNAVSLSRGCVTLLDINRFK